MIRMTVLAVCISLLALAAPPKSVRADEKTEKIVTTAIIAAAIGGAFGLLIAIAGKQAELSDELKKKKSTARKKRAEISPLGVRVYF